MSSEHEPRIRIENREELLYLLAEAAAIEQNLMCCYLYAAWSLKRSEGDGLSPEEVRAVRGWKAAIMSIAIEEMTHLTIASNLAVAIGGAPHLSRPSFPVPIGYHPAGIVLELARFSHPVLDHFIYLERPEGELIPDSEEFHHPGEFLRRQAHGRLMPSAQDYLTVGHLYRGIRHGFTRLRHMLGEKELFSGDPASQIGPDDVSLPGVMIATDLRTADKAIDTIIEQGEGAPTHRDDSHYSRFLRVRAEFEALQKANPSFEPAFPVAHNPVMRRPLDGHDRVFVDGHEAAPTLDLANALYAHALRCLVQAYGRGAEEVDRKRLFVGVAIDLMHVLAPVAGHLASLPASSSHPGVNAGMTFTMLRDVAKIPRGPGENRFMVERLTDMALHAEMIFPPPHPLADIAGTLRRIGTKVEAAATSPVPAAGVTKAADLPPAAPPAAKPHPPQEGPIRGGDVETAEGKDLLVHFNGKRCIHARYCVLWAPKVFKANTPGEWIYPDRMPTEQLLTVLVDCPSGALTYTPKGDVKPEAPPPVNLVNLRENGPYAFRAEMRIAGKDYGFRATLCRCGQSKRKPFCDGSHATTGFKASGEPESRESQPLAVRDGLLEIEPEPNGPLQINGNLEILTGTGRTIDRIARVRFCRCGHSNTKPFCDSTHLKIGFKTE